MSSWSRGVRWLWVASVASVAAIGFTWSGCVLPDASHKGTGDGNGTPGNACSAPDDCANVVCDCVVNSGDFPQPVNTRHCTNELCETPDEACPSSCAAFGLSWTHTFTILPNTTGSTNNGTPDAGPTTGNPGDCGSLLVDNACGSCERQQCCSVAAQCSGSTCASLVSCVVQCIQGGSDQATCESTCTDNFPDGRADYDAFDQCARSQCASTCGG